MVESAEMCLIAYSPNGVALPHDVFSCARKTNPDGIGIVSREGVQRFVGKKPQKRARAVLADLALRRVPYSVHFRWATHGSVCQELTHPYLAADKATYVMHNGVITWAGDAAGLRDSDTSVFVRACMERPRVPDDPDYLPYYELLGDLIGLGNKLCVYHSATDEWTLVNEDQGEWIDGIWYSNTYSLPPRLRPAWIGEAYATAVATKACSSGGLLLTHDVVGSDLYADRNVVDAVNHAERTSLAKLGDYYRGIESGNADADWGAQISDEEFGGE